MIIRKFDPQHPFAHSESPDYSTRLREMTRKIAKQWMEGWGAVERERLVTGDRAAIPSGNWDVVGGRRGKPSGLPGIMEVWMDVDTQIIQTRALHLRYALLFVYRDGIEFFEDEAGRWSKRFVYDWERFEDPEIGKAVRRYGLSRSQFLEGTLRRFLRALERDKGLSGIARSYLEKGIEIEVL